MELKAQVSAYATVFEVSAVIVFIGAIAALWIKAHPYVHAGEKDSELRDPIVVLD